MPTRPAALRDSRTWTVLPAAIAVAAFGVGYLVWLLVGLDAGLECDDTTLGCGGAGWSALIAVLWTVAGALGVVALIGFLTLVVRSVWTAFANLRD